MTPNEAALDAYERSFREPDNIRIEKTIIAFLEGVFNNNDAQNRVEKYCIVTLPGSDSPVTSVAAVVYGLIKEARQ